MLPCVAPCRCSTEVASNAAGLDGGGHEVFLAGQGGSIAHNDIVAFLLWELGNAGVAQLMLGAPLVELFEVVQEEASIFVIVGAGMWCKSNPENRSKSNLSFG